MPPIRSQSARKSTEQEGRLLLAIEAIQKKQIPSIREAARQFNVPHSTLASRLNGTANRSNIRANNHKLSILEEQSLLKWVISMDSRGAAPRHPQVRDMANILLAERGTSPIQTVGEKWVYNFIRRQPELTTRFSRRYDYRRAQCEDPKTIQQWFDTVQKTIIQYGIHPDDIYNFDETGFAMGVISSTRVVTRAEYYGRAKLLSSGNREWVTTIECIRACGEALPPCIIFKAKGYTEGWLDSSLPIGSRIEVSQNGWTTDEIGLRWLQNLFIPATNQRSQGVWRLLILDGHGSHLTPQFDQICEQNKIIPLCMPAHSSHLLQPLDIGCFSVLKRAYSKEIESDIRAGVNSISKLDFLEAYPIARAQSYKSETIKNSFIAAGLVPFNAETVLQNLNIQLKTPTPPGSRGSESSLKTPQNPAQLDKQASSIKALLRRRSQSPVSPTKRALDQIIKGCEVAMHNNAFLAEQCKLLRAANAKQTSKRTKSTKRIAFENGVTIGETPAPISTPNQVSEDQSDQAHEAIQNASGPVGRAPPRCTNCFEIGHRRNQCKPRTK